MFKARDFITDRVSVGRYNFDTAAFQSAVGGSDIATRRALARLAERGEIASPARGYYVVVPPEYRSLGCLPAEQFVPDLMAWLKLDYYVGLLSAAQYYGATHHQPQEFQVIVRKPRRSIQCGKIKVTFIARKNLELVPVVHRFSTDRGVVKVSSPEATALDLVGYQRRAGGLDNIVTVIAELSEQMFSEDLVSIAQSAPISWTQRLGYILENVSDGADLTDPLRIYIQKHAKQHVPLLPGFPSSNTTRSASWKILENAEIASEV